MRISCHSYNVIMAALTVLLLAAGCGDEQQAQKPGGDETVSDVSKAEEPGPVVFDYQDWLTVSHRNVKVIYPPDHAHKGIIEDVPKIVGSLIRTDCQFLGMDVPADTVVMFYHAGPYAGRLVTNREFPFAIGDTIHYFPPFYIGNPIMKYLIPKWRSEEPRHSFLKHGLVTLLDASQRDPHDRTFHLIDSNKFVSLTELAVDDRINCDKEFTQSAEAASFVDFLVLRYGQQGMAKLYQSDTTFDMSTIEVFGMTPDSLEQTWLHVVDSVRTALGMK